MVDPYFSQTFCPPPGADPDGAACAAGDTAGAFEGAPLADAAPDDAEGAPDPAGALVAATEPVAGTELPATGDEGGTAPGVPGADVLGEPLAVVAVAAAWDGDRAAPLDGDPVTLSGGAVVVDGAPPVEEAD